MLLYQIEESLVNFILEQTPQEEIFPQKTVSNIVKRCTDKNISVDKTNIESLLEATYFDEIFTISPLLKFVAEFKYTKSSFAN